MGILTIIARVLVGLGFLVFGLNYWGNFITPPPMAEQAGAFIGILYGSGFLGVVKVIEVVGGALLLASIVLKKYAPLGVVLLAPVTVTIVLFHFYLDPANLIAPLVFLVLEGVLVIAYWDNFRGIFEGHA